MNNLVIGLIGLALVSLPFIFLGVAMSMSVGIRKTLQGCLFLSFIIGTIGLGTYLMHIAGWIK